MISQNQIWTAVNMARAAQIQTQTARQWLRRHWNEIPPPALSVPLGGHRKFLHIWTREDGEIIYAAYQRSLQGQPPEKYTRPLNEQEPA
jgi:hypothetical protein